MNPTSLYDPATQSEVKIDIQVPDNVIDQTP